MKAFIVFFSILIASVASAATPQNNPAQKTKVRAEVWQKVTEKSVAQVEVVLDGQWAPDAKLNREAALAQRKVIADTRKNLIAELAGTKYKVLREYDSIPGISLEVGPDALNVLENSTHVKDVYLERLGKSALLESVPLIGGNQAWTAGYDGTGHAVVIVDTGVDGNHTFLSGKVIAAACFSSGSNCPNAQTLETDLGAGVPCTYASLGCGHGTHVAGIAAGLGNTFSGVAKGAKLVPIQVFSRYTGADCSGMNEDPCARLTTQDVRSALDYIYTSLVGTLVYQIASVNLSLQFDPPSGDQASCDGLDADMKAVIDNLREAGIPTVVASGNNSCNGTGCTNAISFPGCISSAVSVGSTNKSDQVSTFSNSAPFLSLVAPGESICSSVPTGTGATCFSTSDFKLDSGTSMSAPHVAGAWAILKQKNPDATVGQILNALQTTGVKITDTRTGANNRVNCRIQIDQALANIPDTVVTLPISSSLAYGINNCGQIVGGEHAGWTGFMTDTKGTYASVVYNGPLEPEGEVDETEATAINNKGEVAGWYCCGYHGDRGFTRDVNGNDSPATWDCYTNEAYGNNDLGQTVGESSAPDGACSGLGYVLNSDGSGQSFDRDIPLDIDNLSRMAGSYEDTSYNSHGFYYDSSGRQQFDYPGAANTVVSGINESGQIVGCYYGSWHSDGHGFLRNPDGTLTQIDIPGAAGTCASGINDSGQVVGYYWDSPNWPNGYHAFVDLSR